MKRFSDLWMRGLGILKCGCGSAFVGHTFKQNVLGKTYYYKRYECSSRRRARGKCGTFSVKCSVLDGIILDDIRRYVENPRKLKEEYKRNRKIVCRNTESLRGELSKIETGLKGIEAKIDRLLSGYESGVIQLEDYERRSKRLVDERFQCYMKKMEIESLLKNGQESVDEGKIIRQLQDFLKIWKSGSDLQKRMQIKELVKEIVVEGKNRFRIKYNFLP